MFQLFIMLIILVLIRNSVMEHAPKIIKLLSNVHTLPRGGLTSPDHRCHLMSEELGSPWKEWDPAKEESNFIQPTIRFQFVRRYFGPLDMEVAGDRVLIYDLQIGGLLEDEKRSMFQTVISLKPPELELPPFILRPRMVMSHEFLTGQSISTGTVLDTEFDIETLAPHRVKALFQSELGSQVLIPFLMDHRWTVEWTGNQLIVYELNRLIAPQQLAEVALEASEFFELLKSGPEAVDRTMKAFIDSAMKLV